jgi:hypothetical protein
MGRGKRPVGFIIGDSVPMPRAFETNTAALEETWPCLLETRLPQYYWIANCRGSRPVTEVPQVLRTVAHYYQPAFTIVSVGIVDCVYRALSSKELGTIQKLHPYARWLVHRVVKRIHYRLTKSRRISYTPIEEFARSLKEVEAICREFRTTLIYVEILPPGAHMRKVSYGIEANVEKYNRQATEIIPAKQIVNLSDMREEIDNLVTPDGHHLNAIGHARCADRIFSALTTLGLVQP